MNCLKPCKTGRLAASKRDFVELIILNFRTLRRVQVWWVIVAVVFASETASAALTLGQLEASCRVALERDYSGLEAAACDWYLEPCGVCGEQPLEPAWCEPAGLSPRQRAQLFLDALSEQPRERQLAAKNQVELIWQALFPCH